MDHTEKVLLIVELFQREDGGQKITPFNLEEENDEGHFDENGNFIFDKKGEEIRDSWLDSIDNQKVFENIDI